MQKSIKTSIFLIICFLVLQPAQSQDNSPVNLSYNYIPSLLGEDYAYSSLKLNLSYPVIKNPGHLTFLAGVNFRWNHNCIQEDSLYLKDLYYLTVPLSLIFRVSEKYKMAFSLETGLSSDFTSITYDDIRYNGHVRLIRSVNDTMKWAFILQFTRQYSGLSITPNFYFKAKLAKDIYLTGLLPFKPRLVWVPNKTYQVGLGVNTDVNSYQINTLENIYYVEESKADLDLFFHRRIMKNYKVYVSLGYTFLHLATTYDEGEQVPFSISIFDFGGNQSMSIEPDGMVLKVGFFYSLSD